MKKYISLVLVFFLCGCTSMLKKSPDFDAAISKVKTIAIMPPDIDVFQLSAGGVQELMDEWSDQAKELTRQSLEKHLGSRYQFQIKFIDKDWIKTNHKGLWEKNRALYNAVSTSAMIHAYPGVNAFDYKVNNFDYTLGEEVGELAKVCEADALLFVRGFDNEATAGRTALLVWDVLIGAATGVMIIPTNPSHMDMGLVDAATGNVEWFKISPPEAEYSFRNKGHVDTLVEWLTRDFLSKK